MKAKNFIRNKSRPYLYTPNVKLKDYSRTGLQQFLNNCYNIDKNTILLLIIDKFLLFTVLLYTYYVNCTIFMCRGALWYLLINCNWKL